MLRGKDIDLSLDGLDVIPMDAGSLVQSEPLFQGGFRERASEEVERIVHEAEPFRSLELTPENWRSEFGGNQTV